MGIEIERKFLVTGDGWRDSVVASRHIQQAYLADTDAFNLRIRLIDGKKATLTIKSATPSLSRGEFEYAISAEDARALFALKLGKTVEKRRHVVSDNGQNWEIDVFEGAHAGLVIAELELDSADAEFHKPDWLGEEVTGDPRYYNATLARP